jgi:hypothetical protein
MSLLLVSFGGLTRQKRQLRAPIKFSEFHSDPFRREPPVGHSA